MCSIDHVMRTALREPSAVAQNRWDSRSSQKVNAKHVTSVPVSDESEISRSKSPFRGNRIATDSPPDGYDKAVPPGLIAGSGLKLHRYLLCGSWLGSSSRPDRRERIETADSPANRSCKSVPPGLIAGSGLKHRATRRRSRSRRVPPGLIAGSGLKHQPPGNRHGEPRSSRPDRRERIETSGDALRFRNAPVPPGLIAGSGLKLRWQNPDWILHGCSSRPDRRERIETRSRVRRLSHDHVPPGLIAGSGLKQAPCRCRLRQPEFLPA